MALSNNIGQSYIQGRKAMLGLWKGPANGNDDYRHGTDVNSDTTASGCHKWKEDSRHMYLSAQIFWQKRDYSRIRLDNLYSQ
jgi:hypothetical protein